MIEKLPEIQIHSCAKINEKLNEVIDWINDVSTFRVTNKQVTANLPNIDVGELAFLSKENEDLSDEIGKLETELERTRKALDKAKWWLKEIVESHRYTPISTAEMALKEITALEQKDK